MDQEKILSLLCAIPALVAGLTLHEFAHAWTADRLGDSTPRRDGRVTLDPAAHLDLMGSLFFIVMWFSGYGLGWAKPVMTNPRNLQHPRRDSLLISIAGPISNLLQVPFWLASLFVFGYASVKMGLQSEQAEFTTGLIGQALLQGVVLNISLAAFNMVPIPPLDGHWILQSIGGRPVEELFDMIRPYSFLLLFLLVNFTPLFDVALGPITLFAYKTGLSAQFAGMQMAG